MTLLVPELKYKYLHFKILWLQPVNLSSRREGDRGVGHRALECPHLDEMDFTAIKPLLL